MMLGAALLLAAAASADTVAIDVVLDPDAALMARAEDVNARLRGAFPKGFAFDDTHHPHVTVLQRYVRPADLPKVYEAVGTVLAVEQPKTWKLRATKLGYSKWSDLGLASIVIEPTEDLLRFQRKLVDALAPLTVQAGSAAAFFSSAEDSAIDRRIIDYVAGFVPNATGAKFHPHVTVGRASEELVKKLSAEPFEAFTSSPASVSIYQLGHYGTARKRLKRWE